MTAAATQPVSFKVQIASHYESCAYPLSEAIQHGLRYQHTILQQPADSESWFSLYELRKVRPVEASVRIDPKKHEYTFPTIDSAIEFIELMLKESGYEVKRRPNWAHAVYLDPRQMAGDMGLVTSLVIAEHDWEVSVLHYRGLGAEYHNPRFVVTEDGAYTPQSKAFRRRALSEAVQEPEEKDATIVLKSQVEKVLNFAHVSSSGSENDAPVTPPTEGKALLDTLVEMLALGRISTDDFSNLIVGLNKRGTRWSDEVRGRDAFPSKSE